MERKTDDENDRYRERQMERKTWMDRQMEIKTDGERDR
jgi:hypothetical protein